MRIYWAGVLACVLATSVARGEAPPPAVTPARVPGGGVQPQAAVDGRGVIHLISLTGEPTKSDIAYFRSADGGKTWSAPLRVNSRPGSAVAAGTVRGAHLALGRGGRVHVAWMGSGVAEPKAPGDAAPMLYTRLAANGKSFEPQRNVITAKVGLDGGGSVAADDRGNVYVAWHAPTSPKGGEADRRVWVARSADDGEMFAPETALSPDPVGACGCCGMRLAAAGGKLYALYRSAAEVVHRDIYLLASDERQGATASQKIGPMTVGACVMSTAAFGAGGGSLVAAWERQGQIEFGRIDPATNRVAAVLIPPGGGGGRKHPAVAVNKKGDILVAWAEGTGWNKGGSVAWQVFDAEGRPMEGTGGKRDGLPAWGSPAAVATPDGKFLLLY